MVILLRWLRCWPVWRPLGRLTGPAPPILERTSAWLRPVGLPANAARVNVHGGWAERIVVGTCGKCDGEVVYSPRARIASCANGCTVLPRRELEALGWLG